MDRIDLHTHSTASDGTYSPHDLVVLAKKEGVGFMALTDHDSVDGVAEALETGRAIGVKVISGVELSVDHANREMHILGYNVDIDDAEFRANLQKLVDYRNLRNSLMIERLQQLGIAISLEEVAKEAGGKVIGRPHFANVLINKGVVCSTDEAFERFLGAGKPAYVKKEKLTPEEGIALLVKAKGIPVLAHPTYLAESTYNELSSLIIRLKAVGLMGIEAYYPQHTLEETHKFVALAKEHDLLITGGSDFHGINKPNIQLGRILWDGGPVPQEVRINLEERVVYV